MGDYAVPLPQCAHITRWRARRCIDHRSSWAYHKAKETYYRAKEAYYRAKETYHKAQIIGVRGQPATDSQNSVSSTLTISRYYRCYF